MSLSLCISLLAFHLMRERKKNQCKNKYWILDSTSSQIIDSILFFLPFPVPLFRIQTRLHCFLNCHNPIDLIAVQKEVRTLANVPFHFKSADCYLSTSAQAFSFFFVDGKANYSNISEKKENKDLASVTDTWNEFIRVWKFWKCSLQEFI